MTVDEARSLIPACEKLIYANHAAVSPFSEYVTTSMNTFQGQRHSGNMESFESWVGVRNAVRSALGRLINASPTNIALTKNTSEGLSILASGLSWQPGDRIILADCEFPANIYPFLNLERLGVEIDFIRNQNGMIDAGEIERLITPKTRMLSISFVEFLNGFRNDLQRIGEICRRHKVIFSVDSIQGVGALRLDVQRCRIDFLSNGCHKWMMCPQGTAFLYVTEDLLNQIQPAHVGWLSVKNAWDFFDYDLDLLDGAARFEIGTENWLGIHGMKGALQLFEEFGFDQVQERVLLLTDRLINGFLAQKVDLASTPDPNHRSGIVTIRPPSADAAERLHLFLKDNRIVASLREGLIRFSPHFYNTQEEMDRILEIVGSQHR